MKSYCQLAAVLLLATVCAHAENPWTTATLTDLQRWDTGSGAARAQGSFCLALELDGTAYILRYEASWRWSYEPTDLVVGDPVQVKLSGNNLIVKKSKGGDFKAPISRRERLSADRPRASCGLPVIVQK